MSDLAARGRDRELGYLSLRELSRLFRSRALSPVEVTQAVLRRIERTQGSWNAFVVVDPEAALGAARAAEARYARDAQLGPLDGVCVSLKDLLLARGWPTRRGSRTVGVADEAWVEDSPAAARLREAGAVLLGKTTTSEFGLKGMGDSPLTGITRNPWDLKRTPGGSSAGAVTAVAGGLGAIAVGTDGGGSIRVPSAYTGVVGLKPSFGRVPTHPAGMLGAPAHVGPIARSVHDARLLLEVLALPDDRDPYRLPEARAGFQGDETLPLGRVRLGYPENWAERSTGEARLAFERTLVRSRELGWQPVEVALDPYFDAASPLLTTLFNARAAHTLRGFSPEQRGLVDPLIVAAAEVGERLSLLDYLAAEAERTALARNVAQLFRGIDVLLTPATAEAAPLADAEPLRTRAPFTGLFSLTRQPAISVPNGTTQAGLPLGLQLVGRHFEEALLLRVADAFESSQPYVAPPEPA